MNKDEFQTLIAEVTGAISGKDLNINLAADLNSAYPPDSDVFSAIRKACGDGIKQGWMCDQEYGGIKFGRVIKDVDGFSVDVVQMDDVVGPHHSHPLGEIDMVMPLTPGAAFDGQGAGWKVYCPGTAHHPTVSGGAALVLYLLPEGKIEFTR